MYLIYYDAKNPSGEKVKITIVIEACQLLLVFAMRCICKGILELTQRNQNNSAVDIIVP